MAPGQMPVLAVLVVMGGTALLTALFPVVGVGGGVEDVGSSVVVTVVPSSVSSSPAEEIRVSLPVQKRGGDVALSKHKAVTLLVPWGASKFAATTPFPSEQCPVRCKILHREKSSEKQKQQLASADLVFFDLNTKMKDDTRFYDPEANPLRKQLGVLNIENVWGRMPAWLSKWRVRWFAKANESSWWRTTFDVAVSWEEKSLVQYRYWHTLDKSAFFKHYNPRLEHKPQQGAAFIASNCWTRFQTNEGFDRDALVRNLSEHFSVESLGQCGAKDKVKGIMPEKVGAALYNRHGCSKAKPHQKRCITSKYAFFLSYENSIAADYVTEKVYEPLLVGTVPVYVGAPNVENHLPTSHCIIKHTDFPDYKTLAHYLKCVIKTPAIYHHYTAWRERELFSYWKPRFEDATQEPLCKTCVLLAEANGRPLDRSMNPPQPETATYAEGIGTQLPFKECLPEAHKHIGVSFEAYKHKSNLGGIQVQH